jgi:hypothetical protein
MTPIGAYATQAQPGFSLTTGERIPQSGWAAYDKEGRTERVSAEVVAAITASRKVE